MRFRAVADSHESRSLILSTHREFSKWGTAFTDDHVTAAMIDRLPVMGTDCGSKGKATACRTRS